MSKTAVVQSPYSTATTMCHEQQDLFNKTDNLRHTLQLSGYPVWFTDSFLNSQHKEVIKNETEPLASVFAPPENCKEHCWKFKYTRNCYMMTVFKAKHSLHLFMRNRSEMNPQQMAQCLLHFKQMWQKLHS